MKYFISLLLIFSLLSATNKEQVFNEDKPEIIYVGDAMCSWCYAFSPEIKKVKEEFKDKATFSLLNGGLSVGTTVPMDKHMKKALCANWEEINERTGLPFVYGILSKESNFIYDTEPAARAIVCIRQLQPESEFDFFHSVQNAFYAGNKNTADIKTYIDILPAGVDKDKFSSIFSSQEIIKKTRHDFIMSDSLSISGFPSVILKRGDQYTMISSGYTTADVVIAGINKELSLNKEASK
jgi:putative protein-disulfide isomerase